MSDDRLFVTNNAIGRKGYFINLIVIFIITLITSMVFNTFLISKAQNDTQTSIASYILYFFYLVYTITFFSLVDRRIFDIFGVRDNIGYRFISGILQLIIFYQIFTAYCILAKPQLPISNELVFQVSIITGCLFLFIAILIAFIPGKISDKPIKKRR